jgi:hypothetical protein
MRFLPLLSVLGLLVGCAGAWKDTGERGPWCAPNVRSRVFYRDLPSVAGPQHGEVAYEDTSGVKRSEHSFRHELNDYFIQCAFIKKWPEGGTVGSTRQHHAPFDLCLVSMEPTVIVGVERRDPGVSSLDRPDITKYVWLGTPHLVNPIEVRTTLPYHKGARVVWFSPAEDHELHRLDLEPGKASFAIGKIVQISVAVDGARLVTSRK